MKRNMAKLKKEDDKLKAQERAKKKQRKIYDSQVKWIFIFIGIMLLAIFISFMIFDKPFKFKWNNIEFQVTKNGKITYYMGNLGYITSTGTVPITIQLRNDPRVLEKNIPVEADVNLKLIKKTTWFAVSPNISQCPDNHVTILDFSRTLGAFGIYAKAGTTSEEFAKQYNVTKMSCDDANDNRTVIIFQQANQTRIWGNGECYIFDINNCETQESFERFFLELIKNTISS